jgi:hypothetical protein
MAPTQNVVRSASNFDNLTSALRSVTKVIPLPPDCNAENVSPRAVKRIGQIEFVALCRRFMRKLFEIQTLVLGTYMGKMDTRVFQ